MSNFFKPNSVIEKKAAIRVIDSNRIVEEKLAKLAAKNNPGMQGEPGEDSEGFRSLTSMAVETVIEDPEEVLQKAKEEAEQILKEAKETSEQILEDAHTKSEGILQKAKEDGHQEGFAEGEKQARTELEAEFDKKSDELEKFRLELQEDYNREMNQLEPRLLDVILTVVEKVFHIQFDDKKEILLYLIQNTISNIEGSKNFTIRVGEEQQSFIETHKEQILDSVGHNISLEILSDPLFEGSQCVIETESGIFECGLGVQLENLIKDLKSLSS